MAQKLILCEGLFHKDALTYAPVASLLSAGYEVSSLSAFTSQDNRSLCFVLLTNPNIDQTVAPSFALGDINGDGVVNTADLAELYKIILGLTTGGGEGEGDAAEAATMMKTIVGRIIGGIEEGATYQADDIRTLYRVIDASTGNDAEDTAAAFEAYLDTVIDAIEEQLADDTVTESDDTGAEVSSGT